MDPAALKDLISAGPYGVAALFLAGVIYLYLKLDALSEKRAELAIKVEGTLSGNKSAAEAVVKSIEGIDQTVDDLADAVTSLQSQLKDVAQLVGMNGGKLDKIESELLRALIQRSEKRS